MQNYDQADHRPRGRCFVVAWCSCLLAGATLGVSAPSASAQTAPLQWEDLPVGVDSGFVEARDQLGAEGAQVVFSRMVGADGAPWVRLQFGEIEFAGTLREGNNAYLRMTSIEDGGVQFLDARSIEQWQYTSAYFNGDWVLLELLAYPNTGSSRVVIDRVSAGLPDGNLISSICGGTDDRTLSSDARVARIRPVGCTGWLFNGQQHCFLTAGHCAAGGGMSVVEFNVPLSDSNGDWIFADPDDQYPIDPASIQFQDAGCGNDWSYFGAFENSNTGLTPLQAQGASYTLAAPPAPGNQLTRITGYGTTDPPVPDTWNLAQKTHTGPYIDLDGTLIQHQVDTTGGNSGSAIHLVNPNVAIGIHTCAGCGDNWPEWDGNRGTSISHPNLQNALANPQGICANGTVCGPGAGDCFAANGTPGCENAVCCEAVCADDPFCCDSEWDSICADTAAEVCATCGGEGTGSCFEDNGTPACNNTLCCEAVCADDPFCCDNNWDSICADAAVETCSTCGGAGAGSCFEANVTPGCDNAECCDAVCAVDPFCCDNQWDDICANEASEICATCGGAGAGSCFEANGTPGCNNAECCGVVCAADPFCCDNQWDDLCAEDAAVICASCGGAGAGSCFEANGTPGCNDAECCETVCAVDPFCCDNTWDTACANQAEELCVDDPCNPEAGNCYASNGTPGCDNPECCDAVCAADPFCCDNTWDGLCAEQAAEICGDCGNPDAGSCFEINGTPGCDDAECCATVCAADPFCCNTEWDSLCADGAMELCEQPCVGDFNSDGVVDVLDLLELLGDWGSCPGCPTDLNGDGTVNVLDMLTLLGNWGACA